MGDRVAAERKDRRDGRAGISAKMGGGKTKRTAAKRAKRAAVRECSADSREHLEIRTGPKARSGRTRSLRRWRWTRKRRNWWKRSSATLWTETPKRPRPRRPIIITATTKRATDSRNADKCEHEHSL